MPNFSFHYICTCGTLSEPLKKEQYLRLLNKMWLCEKCSKKNKIESLFKLSNGTVVNTIEF